MHRKPFMTRMAAISYKQINCTVTSKSMYSSVRYEFTLLLSINPIRSGVFQTANDPGGGGALKAPPPTISKTIHEFSPYHICAKKYAIAIILNSLR